MQRAAKLLALIDPLRCMRFEVFTANSMMSTVICDMMPCSWADKYHCFEEPAVSLFREDR